MHNAHSIELLCQCLAWWNPRLTAAAERLLAREQVDWEQLLCSAERHLAAPSLYPSLSRSGLSACFPQDVAEYLRAVWSLNRQRNRMLRQALISLCADLNALGITPILLKGAAALAENEDSALSDRIISDLDLFIPDGRSQEAYDALQQKGYALLYDIKTMQARCQHEPSLQHNAFPAVIELHSRILHAERFDDMTERAEQESELIQAEGAAMLLPGPTFRVLHNFLHHSFQDRCFAENRLDIRRLYESVLLRQEKGSTIHYQEIHAYCREKRISAAWLTYCLSAVRLFGSRPVPDTVPGQYYATYKAVQVRLHYRFPLLHSCEDQLRRIGRLPLRLVRLSWYPEKIRQFSRWLQSRQKTAADYIASE